MRTNSDLSGSVGCAVIALALLISVFSQVQSGLAPRALVVALILPIVIGVALLGLAFFQSRLRREPFSRQEWPKSSRDLPAFIEELMLVSAVIALMVVLTGVFVLGSVNWLTTTSRVGFLRLLAVVGMLSVLWFIRWRQKDLVRRNAVHLLSNGPEGIREWNGWRVSRDNDLAGPLRSIITPSPNLDRINLATRILEAQTSVICRSSTPTSRKPI